MSDQKISVTFRAVDGGLAAFIQDIQRKSDSLMASNIKSALEQSRVGSGQLKIIQDQIKLLERKSAIENQAHRQVISNQRDADLSANRQNFTGRKEGVYNDLRTGKINEGGARERLTALDGSERDAQDRIKTNYKDQLSSIRETERQSKLTTSLQKEQLDAIRQTARENVRAILTGDKSLEKVLENNSTEEERLIGAITKEGVNDAKGRESKGGGGLGFGGSLLAVDALHRAMGAASQLTSSSNGFDLIKPASSLAGEIAGGAIGAIIGAFFGPAGAMAGAAMGAEAGELIGNDWGEFKQKKALAVQGNLAAMNRYRAVTGSDGSSYFDTSDAGIASTDFIKARVNYARLRGYGGESSNTTARDALYAEKGFGISYGTSAGVIEIQRSAKEGNRDLAGLISGILEKAQGNILKGTDRAFTDELLTKFTALQQTLLKVSETVPTGLTMDILSRFNSVGGGFEARDPRSAGWINSIQSGLSSPGSDNIRALAFRVLSQHNPNAGIFDLRESMQKGLGSPGYLRGILGQIDRIGGGDQAEMNNLSGLFPGLPLSAIRRLYNNRSGLMNGNLSVEDLKAKFPLDFKGAAEANTTPMESNAAKVANAYLREDEDTINSMTAAFKTAFTATMAGAVIELKNGRILFNRPSQNVVRKPTSNGNTSKQNNIDAGIGWSAGSGDPY